MPDTEIVVGRDETKVTLTIHVPVADLLLALPASAPRDIAQLLSGDRTQLRAYFADHLHLTAPHDRAVPAVIDATGLLLDHDEDVGDYREVEVEASARVPGNVPLRLDYDGVLHRIANHRAVVTKMDGAPLGVIRYSLAERRSTPVELRALPEAPLASGENGGRGALLYGLLALEAVMIIFAICTRRKFGSVVSGRSRGGSPW